MDWLGTDNQQRKLPIAHLTRQTHLLPKVSSEPWAKIMLSASTGGDVIRRILVVGMTDNPGGIESVVMAYYRALDKSKFQFDFLANTETMAYQDEVEHLGGTVYHIPPRHSSPIAYFRALLGFFKLHAVEYSAIWLNVCSLANIDYLVYAKRFGIGKRIIHCHNSQNGEGLIRGLLHRTNLKRIRHLATDFWSCSDRASVWFYGKDFKTLPNYRWIPNAVDANRFKHNNKDRERIREELHIPPNCLLLGNVARLQPQKNHEKMVSVFAALHAMDERYRLLFIGKGELEQKIRAEISAFGLNDEIILAGEQYDMPPFYQAMDAFLFLSIFEGFAVSPLEAQACGLPCILSSANPPESFINSNLLRIDISESSEQIASQIHIWLQSPQSAIQEHPNFMNSPFIIKNQIESFEEAIE